MAPAGPDPRSRPRSGTAGRRAVWRRDDSRRHPPYTIGMRRRTGKGSRTGGPAAEQFGPVEACPGMIDAHNWSGMQGPNGLLYVLTAEDHGALLRIEPTGS